MNCYYCKGVDTLEERNTRLCVYDIPEPFVVEQVPARVCRLCGDKSFTGNVVEALEKIRTGEAQADGFQSFRVFDFKHLVKNEQSEKDSEADLTAPLWAQKMDNNLLLEERGSEVSQREQP